MGTYTTVKMTIKLRNDTPKDIIALLHRVIVYRNLGLADRVIFKSKDVFKPEFEHDFFKCERWYMLFIANNFEPNIKSSFILKSDNEFWQVRHDTLNIHSEYQNRDGELDAFIDWITPYVLGRKKKQYIGYYQVDCRDRENIYIER